MSQKQLQVYHVLVCVLEDKMTLMEAAQATGYSYRHLRRLKAAVKEHGAKGLVHGNKERVPVNKTSSEIRDRILTLSKEEYGNFNDTHFTEMLSKQEGLELSRETVRVIRRDEGIKPKRKRRIGSKHRKRRERKAAEGAMILWDGSPHRWFGSEENPLLCDGSHRRCHREAPCT